MYNMVGNNNDNRSKVVSATISDGSDSGENVARFTVGTMIMTVSSIIMVLFM
jgi:hypothetical protein